MLGQLMSHDSIFTSITESRFVAQLVPPRRTTYSADRILAKREPVLTAAGNVPREKSTLPAFALLRVAGISTIKTPTSAVVATRNFAVQTLTTSKLPRLTLRPSGAYQLKSIDYAQTDFFTPPVGRTAHPENLLF
jgi:hypothetical protein